MKIDIRLVILFFLSMVAFSLSCHSQDKPYCLDRKEKEKVYKLIQENELLVKRGLDCDTTIISLERENMRIERASSIKDTIISAQIQIIDRKDRIIFDKSGQIENGQMIISIQDRKIVRLSQENILLEKSRNKEVRRKRVWRGGAILLGIGMAIAIIL
jgi:hypothetical protein